MFKKSLFTLGQIYRSWQTAIESVVINKLRTGLSLSGITIGIFAIITVFTLVDSMEIKIRDNVNSLGSNTLYIGKWPWDGGGQWWKYYNRPQVSLSEYHELRTLLPQAQAIAFATTFTRTVKNGSNYVDNTSVIGATYEYDRMRKSDIGSGRYFTPYESEHGSRVVIIGHIVAEKLFPGENPIGKDIRIGGTRLTVIGVFDKAGDDMMGMSMDANVLIPLALARNFVNLHWAGTEMIVKGPDGGDVQELKAEVGAIMRRLRRLSPQTEDNFAVNEMSILSNQLDSMFRQINFAGGIIGLFSILVGGFGVANIMFVSVRERTTQIGIQKALGARPYFILFQFVFEAVILSVAGGAIGLLLIFFGVLIVNSVSDFTVVLTFGNIVLGLAISSAVGAVAGFFPAWSAARMEPVKAIYHT
ncbi:ABC transporter permease [uncultured Rikenella sp.]|uniref:ABC transporter permease n=1 Tax=uncultured Rikenella sp. TaxID=368003 RepID=UPI0026137E68|nr:ABC transporter permease [uncultured Rikenella sp.]